MTSMKAVIEDSDAVHEDGTRVEHDLGEITMHSEEVDVGAKSVENFRQQFPQNPIGNFLTRPTMIANQVLQSTDAALTLLTSWDVWNLYLSDTPIADKVKNYAYISGTMEVTLVVAAPAGGYGLYIASAVCDGGVVASGNTEMAATQHVEAATQCMHGMIDIARASDIKFTLPFIWPYDVGTVAGKLAQMWVINLWTFLPLTSATSDATLLGSVRVYARLLDDYQLVVPVQQVKKLLEMREHVNDKIKGKLGMKASELANKVSGVASKLAAVPFIGSLAGPVAAGAAAVGSVLDYFGFTRETAEVEPTPVILRNFSNVANIDGKDTSEVAALSVRNSISFDPTIGGGTSQEDLMAFNYLFPKMTLVKVMSWTTAMTANTSLGSLYVSPFYCRVSGTGNSRLYSLTVAGYVMFPFQLWRGGMIYWVVIPVSMFHRGSLQISWSAAGSGAGGDVTNQLLNCIFDVTASSEMKFNVGYSRDVPAMYSQILTDSVPVIVPIGAAANGQLEFRVVNPLTASVDNANTTVFVFAGAMPDMQCGNPKLYETVYAVADNTPTLEAFATTFTLQAGALGDEAEEDEVISLVPVEGKYPADKILWGEHIQSVRPLMQKFSHDQNFNLDSFESSIVAQSGVLMPHFAMPPHLGQFEGYFPNSSTIGQYCFSWSGYYMVMYTGIAGSARYKYVSRGGSATTNNANMVTFCHYDLPPTGAHVSSAYATAFFNTVAPVNVLYTEGGSGTEVLVPYYSTRKWYLTREFPACTNLTTTTAAARTLSMDLMSIYTNLSGPTQAFGNVFRALGPDVRVVQFRFTPRISLKAASGATTAPPVW